MATQKITSSNLLLQIALFVIAPLVGAGIGYLSPHELREQAKEILHKVWPSDARPPSPNAAAAKQKDSNMIITNASGEIICADGRPNETPCWRMRMERELVNKTPGSYSPSAPEQLYGILKERTGPNGTIMSLGKKNDITEPNRPKRKKSSSGSRLDAAKNALSN